MATKDPATGQQLTSCTPETVHAICAHLSAVDAPCSLRAALRRVGLHPSSYYDWQRRALEREEPYASAVDAIEAARDVRPAAVAAEIRKIGREGTKEDAVRLNALKWDFEKFGGSDWNPPARAEVTGKDGGAIEHRVAVDADALCDWLDAFAGAPPGDGASNTPSGPAGDEPGDAGGGGG